MTKRWNVTTSDDLYARWKKYEDEISPSAIFQAALRREVEERETEEARQAGRRAVLEATLGELADIKNNDLLALIQDPATPDHIRTGYTDGVIQQLSELQELAKRPWPKLDFPPAPRDDMTVDEYVTWLDERKKQNSIHEEVES